MASTPNDKHERRREFNERLLLQQIAAAVQEWEGNTTERGRSSYSCMCHIAALLEDADVKAAS